MTYEADGRQFVVIASGGHLFINVRDIDDWLVAYALPD
jgi:glucose dehydrogenase